MKKILFLFLMCGCVSGSAETEISASDSITIPGFPIASIATTVAEENTFDLSKAVNKLEDIGSVTISVNENSLSSSDSNIDFLQHLKIVISTTDNSFEDSVISDYDFPSNQSFQFVNIPVILQPEKFDKYVKHGEFKLQFIFTGILPERTTNLNYRLTLGADLNVHKSL